MAKAADLFRINLVPGKPLEVLLAKFLKLSEGTGKEKVIWALLAHYYSIALSKLDAKPEEIELAAIESIAKLRSQISYIKNYHRLNDGIDLTEEMDVSISPKASPTVEPIPMPVTSTAAKDISPKHETFDLTIFDE
jgi:hypothetical protein